ncbi:Hypothetical protein, conserved [Brucella abortus str. 2308 A]|uniref:DUF465 domain-containing protein n=1 Tax=Brucella ceti str. Cudo TaxID=595497 RepID=C0G8D9_9HYPH|nr:Hypothetical protein, conserved [Brucella ceti str. Cudo]EEP62990.1 Hypothetical protein, conserved [Brucella abortus str. 2308 A]
MCRAFHTGRADGQHIDRHEAGFVPSWLKSIKGDLMMAIESHLATLEKKHGALEEEISEAMASPAMDDLHIASLKRKKLVLKEQIEKLKSQVTRH